MKALTTAILVSWHPDALTFGIVTGLVLLIVKTTAIGFALKFVELWARRTLRRGEFIRQRTGLVDFVEKAVCICFALKFV